VVTGTQLTRGLQAERTALAHGRTQLVAVGVAALIVRQSSGRAEAVLAAVIVSSSVLLVSLASWRRSRHLRHDRTSAVVPGRTPVALIVATLAMQVAGVIVVL
jgi:hypothetical protein